MSDRPARAFTYLLVDNGLLQEVSAGYEEDDAKRRPVWLEPIYGERALKVSPLLIDIEAADESGDIELVMRYLNARKPALHASIIESSLNLTNAAQHLRRFIFILDPEGKQFTLRFADGAVLGPLSSILTAAQWATMKGPISRWGIHDRSGSIVYLSPGEQYLQVPTPLTLDREQLAALDEASEPDHFIAKVRMMRHDKSLPGTPVEQYTWALKARQIWRLKNITSSLILERLTEAALITRGKVLQDDDIEHLLETDNPAESQEGLSEL
ncbi:DUF4123 domain-containing protein [Telluria beijingensis]|uniref:DUF4123 domain-containing protein n=1 Tax=Telluria beijingensis TaxID=3068633 RepID=UPI0027953E81|nr:DUF4123 domain-containing protein [Massilia sp. REN29]